MPDFTDEEKQELFELYDRWKARQDARKAEYGESAVETAIEILQSGGMEASHHMQWTIDQALRTLMGEPRYETWLLQQFKDGYTWDEGVAP
jgi:hypothetical protein